MRESAGDTSSYLILSASSCSLEGGRCTKSVVVVSINQASNAGWWGERQAGTGVPPKKEEASVRSVGRHLVRMWMWMWIEHDDPLPQEDGGKKDSTSRRKSLLKIDEALPTIVE
jgi:hypothetical protein